MDHTNASKPFFNFTDPRVNDWPMMASPIPTLTIFVLYLVMVRQGPKSMEKKKAINLSWALVIYNGFLVVLSVYMFYEVNILFHS